MLVPGTGQLYRGARRRGLVLVGLTAAFLFGVLAVATWGSLDTIDRRLVALLLALNLALLELPWRQRASWLLRELEGFSYEEIARVLDTTPGVVRGQLHRARRTLATRMEQWR